MNGFCWGIQLILLSVGSFLPSNIIAMSWLSSCCSLLLLVFKCYRVLISDQDTHKHTVWKRCKDNLTTFDRWRLKTSTHTHTQSTQNLLPAHWSFNFVFFFFSRIVFKKTISTLHAKDCSKDLNTNVKWYWPFFPSNIPIISRDFDY